jgi:hypothetical protein
MNILLGVVIGMAIVLVLQRVRLCQWSSSDDRLVKMLRQSARYSIAATQDANPMIAVLHANYGVGYLNALKSIASYDEIESVADVNMRKFSRQTERIQYDATGRLIRQCPRLADDFHGDVFQVYLS